MSSKLYNDDGFFSTSKLEKEFLKNPNLNLETNLAKLARAAKSEKYKANLLVFP